MSMLTPNSLRDRAMVKSQSKMGRWVVGGCAVNPTAFKISTTGAKPFVSKASVKRNKRLISVLVYIGVGNRLF